jgi:gluconolactonase
MQKLILIFCFFLLSFTMAVRPPYPTMGRLVRLDPRFDKLIAPDAKIEVLATGFVWSEGPVWVKAQANTPGYLLFSDVPQNTIFRWNETDGLSTFLKPSGYTGIAPYSEEPGSNGLTIDQQGRLIACEHGDRRISAMPLTGGGGKRTLADNFQGKRFNSPNDVVAHSKGSYYFTDPPYGLPKREDDPSRETPIFGVYRIGPDGSVSLIISDLVRPNGVALSPDEKTLYIAQSDGAKPVIMAYSLQDDGGKTATLGPGRELFNALALIKQGLNGVPDGLKTDSAGNIWTTGPGGVLILAPDGTLLGRIETGQLTANCAWGDDGKTLYMTADGYLCRIKVLSGKQ